MHRYNSNNEWILCGNYRFDPSTRDLIGGKQFLCDTFKFLYVQFSNYFTDPVTIKRLLYSTRKSFIGQSATFRCFSDGYPKPVYEWKTPNPNGRHNSSREDDSSILNVEFVSSADFGNYTCSVKNSISNSSQTVPVTQLCKYKGFKILCLKCELRTERYSAKIFVQTERQRSEFCAKIPKLNIFLCKYRASEINKEFITRLLAQIILFRRCACKRQYFSQFHLELNKRFSEISIVLDLLFLELGNVYFLCDQFWKNNLAGETNDMMGVRLLKCHYDEIFTHSFFYFTVLKFT